MKVGSKADFLTLILLALCFLRAHADTVYYTLGNVVLEEGPQMTGIFSWTYTPGDFENGAGQFISLDIPYTAHDHTDLDANIDATQSIEITLADSVHDDGVDITLVLAAPLTPTNSAPLVLGPGESKYEIGGNGFHTGLFVSGSIAPIIPELRITLSPPGLASLWWEPDLPGYTLEQSTNLTHNSWTNAASGSTNPAAFPLEVPTMFFRLKGAQ